MTSSRRIPLPRSWRRIAGRARYWAAELADRWFGNDESLLPPRALRFVGGGDFEAVGEQFLGHFRDLGGLEPHHRVLDVGCGIGRMAVPLTRFLTDGGTYDGFDIVPHGIAWCTRRITRRHPNFRFRLVSIRNDDYNPGGSLAASQFVFPYEDASFDFVFLTSVFTHMLPDDVENYLRETSRVLAPGGRCFVTWFLLNPQSRRLLADGKSVLDFRHAYGSCLTTDVTIREQAIAYEQERVEAMYAGNGLVLQGGPAYGAWCGRTEFVSFQDIIVARKVSVAGWS